jgi:hypothetical protein
MPTTKPAAKLRSSELSSTKPGAKRRFGRLHTGKPRVSGHSGNLPPARVYTAKPWTAQQLTQERVISILQAAAGKLGHAPSSSKLKRLSGITASQVARRFGTYRAAAGAAMRLASGAEARRTKGIETHPESDVPAVGGEMRQPAAGGEMRRTEEINPKEIHPQEITAMATVLPPPLWGKRCVTATMLAVFLAELTPSGLQ